MTKGTLSWRISNDLQQGDLFEEEGKTFEVLYVWEGGWGPVFVKPGVENLQYVPRKVRVKEL